MAESLIGFDIVGLRGAKGRFARGSVLVEEAQAIEMAGAMREILQIVRESAPKAKGSTEASSKSGGGSGRPDITAHGPFAESFTGHIEGGEGTRVAVEITTDQPILRTFLREGTKPHPIGPKLGKALAFTVEGGKIVVAHVDHPGTRPNRWEEGVHAKADVLLQEIGNRIGHRVTKHLAGE